MSTTMINPPSIIENSNTKKLDNLKLTKTKTTTIEETLDNLSPSPVLPSGHSEITLPDYERIKVVGQGSFGVAILYRKLKDDSTIVLKQIHLSDLTKSEKEMAMNEVDVFSKLHHPNIIWYSIY